MIESKTIRRIYDEYETPFPVAWHLDYEVVRVVDVQREIVDLLTEGQVVDWCDCPRCEVLRILYSRIGGVEKKKEAM